MDNLETLNAFVSSRVRHKIERAHRRKEELCLATPDLLELKPLIEYALHERDSLLRRGRKRKEGPVSASAMRSRERTDRKRNGKK